MEAIKDKFDIGEYDQEGDMAKSDLRSIMANAKKMHDMIKDDDNLPEWVQSKITKAEDYISTVANYMAAEMSEETKLQESGGPVVYKKGDDHIEKYGKDSFALYKDGKKAKYYTSIEAAKEAMNEEWSKTGKEAKHRETGEKTYEYAKVDKEGRKTGEREYRNAQGKSMGEAVEQIDEISKKTLGSYINKAASNIADKSAEAQHKRTKAVVDYDDNIRRGMSKKGADTHLNRGYDSAKPDINKVNSRMQGVQKAISRLSKEDVEIEEQHTDEGKFKPTVPKNVRPTAGVTPREKFTQKVVREDTLDEGKMGELHADLSDHLDKHISNYKKVGGAEHFGNKTTQVASKIAKMHGIQQHHAQKFVNDYVENKLKEEKENVPFDPPYRKIKGTGTVTDKSGAKHTPMSRARDLARAALKRQQEKKVNEQSNIQPNPFTVKSQDLNKVSSRKAQIVRDAMKKSKKSDDAFQAEPVLANTVDKSAN
jgi:hypothetical protein